MRPIFIAGGAAAVLIAAGLLFFIFSGDTPPVKPVASVPAAPDEKPSAALAPAKDDADMARLKQENALLKQQLDNLREELSKTKQDAALAAEPTPEAAKPTTEEMDAREFWGDVRDAAGGEEDQQRRERGNRGQRGGWDPQRAQEFRAQMDQFYDDAISQGGPPEVTERLTALQDYSNQMMELRDQIRSAADDSSRDALRTQMDELRDEMKPLVKDQQEYLLRQAAEGAGVTDPKTQNRVADAVRDTMRSPFFTMGARGPGGRGGGPPEGGGAPAGGGGKR